VSATSYTGSRRNIRPNLLLRWDELGAESRPRGIVP